MLAVIRIIEHFHPTRPARVGIHPTAVVDATATIGEGTEIGPKVVIEAGARVGARTRIEAGCFIGEGVEIGEDCWLSPNVTVLTGSHLGRRVRVYPGAVIGADGFRFEVLGGRLRKIPQVGRVVIEDDVEIGANATIDRAFLTETRIGARTKMDNAVHIAHNVEVGSDCILVAQVAIAGSTKVGRGVQVGGAAVMKDHITVGDGARIGGRAGVQSNLPPRAQVMGTPALDVKDYARFMHFYKNFGEYWDRLRAMLDDFEKRRKHNQ
jgi:UDP-3-O-[3-hydroxymyristoyl] glucosamine N-acyltransferase